MSRQDILDWIDNKKWTNAKTYEKTAPHEYLWRDSLKGDDLVKYKFLCKIIEQEGRLERFYSVWFKYWYYGEHKYWVMGEKDDKTQIINRAKKQLKY